MLVLRRRAGESVLIGNDIEIQLLSLSSQGAKIGICAPRETVILRKELRITQRQNEFAARTPAASDFQAAVKNLLDTSRSTLAPR